MSDIVAFLTARLWDDEAQAIAAAEEFGPDWIEIWSGTVDLSANLPDRQPPPDRGWETHVPTYDAGVSRHMVRHDPARVLREVKAKRELMEHAFALMAAANRELGECFHDRVEVAAGLCPESNLDEDEILHMLAAPYADHPDYDQAWGSA